MPSMAPPAAGDLGSPTAIVTSTVLASMAATLATAASPTTTAMMAATTTATPMTAGASDGGSPGEGSGECRLLGSFALFVQLALGGLALMSLVFKRWKERPQRPVKIWFFDVSKQVFGSVLVHMANVFMSMLTSGRVSIKLGPATAQTMARLMRRDDGAYSPNPCSFYLLNLAIDTTLGIPILILLLRICTAFVAYTPLGKPAESIRSGNYGTPPNAWWWLKQSVIYFCGLFGMKICVLIIFLLMPWISRVGDWALGWTEGNEKLQIIFVMMLFPLIMNALQYYIIDSFIKNQHPEHHMPLAFEDSDDPQANARTAHFDDRRTSIGSDVLLSNEDENGKPLRPAQDDEYDPDVDGDAPTVIGSSTSGRGPAPRMVLPKELYPHE